MLFEWMATLCSGVFTGASIYINLVEHPARMQCGTAIAVTEFALSYKRAAVMQASLAACGCICALLAWLWGSPVSWLIGGIFLGAVIPFTLLVIFPTNRQLLDSELDKNSTLAEQLLFRWGKLHAVRSWLSLASFVLFLLA